MGKSLQKKKWNRFFGWKTDDLWDANKEWTACVSKAIETDRNLGRKTTTKIFLDVWMSGTGWLVFFSSSSSSIIMNALRKINAEMKDGT